MPAIAATKSAGTAAAANIKTLRQLLGQREGQIDLARAKVTIDHMVDPKVDVEGTLRQLDTLAAKVRARFPPGASNKVKANILVSTLYKPGPWNDHRPFGYDYSDPYGKDIHKSLLSTYLVTRKGQCVIMPIAVVLLGQKLGLPMTMTTAPYHLIVKYGDEEQGTWTNLDATSGLFHDDGGYEQALNISQVALENGVFLRPFSQKESVSLFATAVLAPYYLQTHQPEQALQVIDLILAADPKDVTAMTLKANAYALLVDQRFRSRYPLAEQIPPAEQAEFLSYNRNISEWRSKAETLGWREWTKADWDKYLKRFAEEKSKAQGGG
ncbi:transglutaminase-like domain-containing protein [Xanthomonas hyacinthi]|uniref:transglutaminase-like domain-containing protein n=1 Tax=Xanthomonas hyacinthi TaxID=56455 RepID=UPI001FCC3CEF|nr:transglutaminase-like domain-containing protein [Xanthomonas hyacinthi]